MTPDAQQSAARRQALENAILDWEIIIHDGIAEMVAMIDRLVDAVDHHDRCRRELAAIAAPNVV